jgi:N-acetyl-1-D-myo-inositol-2-amino-2-deoxy-alpha-D-glucopyranoside deacetylase
MIQPRMLACFAHPDDEAFAASGFLASCTARGVDVRLVCATCGEEGDIRAPGSAQRETLGQVRCEELRRSCQVLGLQEPILLGYRDSGWGDAPAQYHPRAFVNAPAEEVVRRLVVEMRRFRPQMVLTFEPGGLSGHKDHMAISKRTTVAFQTAGNPKAFPEHTQNGLAPYHPRLLYYVARPRGFRLQRALQLRQAGMDVPLPPPELRDQGVPPEAIHAALDVSAHLDRKIASMLCHRTQIDPDWPFLRVPRDVAVELLGQEHIIRAYPPVPSGTTLSPDLLSDLVVPERG